MGDAVVNGVRSVMGPHRAPVHSSAPASGWLVVSVFRDVSEVDTAQLPAPLAEYGDRIDVRVRPAADDKGTELGARLRSQPSDRGALSRLAGEDPQGELRSALRQAKQLIEVGEVLAVDPAPHGDRPATPPGALLETWTRVARKGGVR
jgi:hypothetical protein